MKDDYQPNKYTTPTFPWQCEELNHLIKNLTTENQKKISSPCFPSHSPVQIFRSSKKRIALTQWLTGNGRRTMADRQRQQATGNGDWQWPTGNGRMATATDNGNGQWPWVTGNGDRQR